MNQKIQLYYTKLISQSGEDSPSPGQKLLERRLVDDNVANGTQALTAGLLLLEQLPAAGDIAGMQLGQDILTEGLDGLTGDNAFANGSLNDNLCEESVSRLPSKNGTGGGRERQNVPNICLSTCSLNLVTHCLPRRSTWLACTTRAMASTACLLTSRFILTSWLCRHPASS